MTACRGAAKDEGRQKDRRLERPPCITRAQLREAVRAAAPAAILVEPRVLRRVIRHRHKLPALRLRLPHQGCYVVPRGPLVEIADRDELGLAPGEELPEVVILLPAPDDGKLAASPARGVLLEYWRRLFHGAVHAEFDRRVAAGQITPADVRGWIARIGAAEFDEARAVLDQEGFLLSPCDDRAVFAEFAAVFLELEHFARGLLPYYFPAIEQPEAVSAVLAEAVDARRLLAGARPAGAPSPAPSAAQGGPEDVLPEPDALPAAAGPGEREVSEGKYRRLARRAEAAESRGNLVRALLWWQQARRAAPKARAGHARAALRRGVDLFVQRLQAALGPAGGKKGDQSNLPRSGPEGASHKLDSSPFSGNERSGGDPLAWRGPLAVLAERASRGVWTREGRLLYDLQKICLDHERNVFKIDLAGWLRTLGRQPVKRALPSQRDVLMVRHLQAAMRRLGAVRLADAQRRELNGLIRDACKRCEERLRARFRPVIVEALDQAGLAPANLPEEVARDKAVEELLDQVAARGFLRMSDLRDALARSDLKLSDLDGPASVTREPLLRADRRLGQSLDGVHRRGEVYLRWMQRLSALGFGTRPGRLFTRFVAVPFGGAFVVLAGLLELGGLITGTKHEIKEELHWLLPGTFALGLFLLGLVNAPAFRAAVVRGLRAAWRGARLALVDVPLRIARLPLVRRVLQSRWWGLGWRFLIKPAALAGLLCLALYGKHAAERAPPLGAFGIFLAVNVLVNSRFGRDVEEISREWAVLAWDRFGLHVFLRLFWLVMEVSQAVLEGFERLLYAVDEWLRFRSGQGRAAFALKAVLGLFWAGLTYVVRFAVTVLIEPQINPVKHFPVVTVSHKLLFMLIWPLAGALEMALGLDKATAWTAAAAVIWSIPGMFGFLVWELKENWRLYAANRPPRLAPAPIGHHGETMGRFLRPGFHSGTVPKRFARLRRAARAARAGGSWAGVRKHQRKLREVEESVRRHVARETAALIARTAAWRHAPPRVAEVRLATNRVRVELRAPGAEGPTLWITFDLRGGLLLGRAEGAAALAGPGAEKQEVLGAALLGLFERAGTDATPPSGQTAPCADVPESARAHAPLSPRGTPWDDWVRFWDAARTGGACKALGPGPEPPPS